jgi:hypothetical protein
MFGFVLHTHLLSMRSDEMDRTKAGKLIAEQLEAIESEYGDSEDHDIGAVITIVEITGPGGSELRIRNNMSNPVLALGFLGLAANELVRSMRPD